MSQPRRRRRRRRGGGQGQESGSKQEAVRQPRDGKPSDEQGPKSGRSRRRRGRSRSGGGGRQPSSPKSSEDLVRALPKEPPAQLTAPADGQTLEQVIGDLQSTWGVPPYPQEYRITLKVAEERDQRPEQTGPNGDRDKSAPTKTEQPRRERANGDRGDQPRREKAPAAPGVGSSGSREKAPRKRRRRRRRGGGGGGEGGTSSGPPREKA